MAYTAEVTDNFNRSDADALGTGWTETYGDIDIVSNTAKAISKTGYWAAACNTGTLLSSADEYVQAKMYQGSAGDQSMGLSIRSSDDQKTAYTVMYRESQTDFLFYRNNGSTDPSVLKDGANTQSGIADGSTFLVRVTGTGATVTVKVFVNGVEKDSADDTSASRITTAGHAGIWTYYENNYWDDFEAGIIVEDAPTFIPKVMMF